MEPLRICLVDSNGITRKGIATTIEQGNLPTGPVEALESLDELTDLMTFTEFDLLLLDDGDLSPIGLSEIIKSLLSTAPALKIIILSVHLHVSLVQRSIQSGAKGFMYKYDDLDHVLLSGIYTVHRGLIFHSPKISELLSTHNQLIILNNLKPIDLKVLRLTARGLTVKAIAAELGISPRSIYRSRDKLRETMGATNIVTLIDVAREQGLLESE